MHFRKYAFWGLLGQVVGLLVEAKNRSKGGSGRLAEAVRYHYEGRAGTIISSYYSPSPARNLRSGSAAPSLPFTPTGPRSLGLAPVL